MYDLCTDRNHLTVERERIVRLMMSFNEPIVAPVGHHAQPTPAYICTIKEDEGFSVHIYLYLSVEKVGLLYTYAEKILNTDECRTAEDEAIQFVEQMGCLMDDLYFNNLLSEQQDKLLTTIPVFSPTVEKAAEESRLNELEAEKSEDMNEPTEKVVEKVNDSSAKVAKKRIKETAEMAKELDDNGDVEKDLEAGKKTDDLSAKEKGPIETSIFLSKFRRRAMAEKDKITVVERLGRLLATI